MHGAKILITGPTGQVASPIAQALAADNEVWGIARFTNAAAREALEKSGVRCETVNLAAGEFDGLPSDFDYVLNLAVAKSGDWDKDLAANAESVGLLMAHCRKRKSVSTLLLGAPSTTRRTTNHEPSAPPWVTTTSRCFRPIPSPRSPGEVVARTMARALDVPTTIARLNVPYGDNGGWPFYHMEMMLGGIPIPVPAGGPARYNPIHEDDIIATYPEAACGGIGSGDNTSTGAATRPSASRTGAATSARLSARNRSSRRASRRCAVIPPTRAGCARSLASPRSTGATECAGWRPKAKRHECCPGAGTCRFNWRAADGKSRYLIGSASWRHLANVICWSGRA